MCDCRVSLRSVRQMGILKKRAFVREVVGAVQLHFIGDDIRGAAEIREARSLSASSKFQTVKWGVVCFVLGGDIVAMTKSGNGLGIGLGGIWRLTGMGGGFGDCLGRVLVTRLEELTDPLLDGE